ncbi:DUF222 domain-containing protein [Ruania rhizosphaerae]|uniref:DUF222 domain-containing protein n=1 Tax=Ruania rhizosphaerae TaxID=1840413 RepID=UPI0030846A3D
MANNQTDLIAGKPRALLIESLRNLELGEERDGMRALSGNVDYCVVRALARIEAQLLLEDADSPDADRLIERTTEQRRADAFVALVAALADGVPAGAASRARGRPVSAGASSADRREDRLWTGPETGQRAW